MPPFVGPITALRLVFRGRSALCGLGGSLVCYCTSTGLVQASTSVFSGGCLHGIQELQDAEEEGNITTIAVYGQKRLAILELTRDSELKVIAKVVADYGSLKDWILAVHPLKGSESGCGTVLQMVIGYAHNEVSIIQGQNVVHEKRCQPLALLYSMALWGNSRETLLVAAGTILNDLVLWSGWTGHMIATLSQHEGSIFSLSFDISGNRVLSASDDRTLILWSGSFAQCTEHEHMKIAQDEVKIVQLFGHLGRVWRCLILSDLLVSCGEDKKCILWDFEGNKIRVCEGHGHQAKGFWALSAYQGKGIDLGIVAAAGNDGVVRFWPLQVAKQQQEMKSSVQYGVDLPGPNSSVKSVAVGPMVNGETAASVLVGTHDGGLYEVRNEPNATVWEWEVCSIVDPSSSKVIAVQICLSKKGDALAVAWSDATLTVYKICDRKGGWSPVSTWVPHQDGPVFFASFSHVVSDVGHHILCTATAKGTLTAWMVQDSMEGQTQPPSVSYYMPKARERVACILLSRRLNMLLVGDVVGNVHAFDATLIVKGSFDSNETNAREPIEVLRGIHSGKAVRHLEALVVDQTTSKEIIVSVGLDGTLAKIVAMPYVANYKPDDTLLSLSSRDTQYNKNAGALLGVYYPQVQSIHPQRILGIKASHLLLWDCSQGYQVLNVECGGRKELIACSFKDLSGGDSSCGVGHTLAWVTDSKLCIASSAHNRRATSQDTLHVDEMCRVLGVPYHGAEVHHVQWVPHMQERGFPLILSASEDTTLSMHRFCSSSAALDRVSVLHGGHTSGVRITRCIQLPLPKVCSDPVNLCVSAGGQEGLCIWEFPSNGEPVVRFSCSISQQYRSVFHPDTTSDAVNMDEDKEESEDEAEIELSGRGARKKHRSGPLPGQEKRWQSHQKKQKNNIYYRALSLGLLLAHPTQEVGGKTMPILIFVGGSDSLLKVFAYFHDENIFIPIATSKGGRSGPLLSLSIYDGRHKGSGRVIVFAGATTADILAWDVTHLLNVDPQPMEGRPIVALPMAQSVIQAHQSGVNCMALWEMDTGCLLVSGGDDQSLRVTNLAVTLDDIRVIESVLLPSTHSAGLRSVCVDQDAIYSAGDDQRITVYNWKTQDGPVASMSVNAVAWYLVDVSGISSIDVWHAQDGQPWIVVAGKGMQVMAKK